MMAKLNLDEILKKLEDDETVSKVTDKHEEARSSYQIGKRKATTYKGIKDELTSYIKHHRKVVDGTELPDYRAENEAHNLIVSFGRRLLGDENAKEKDAIKAVIDQIGAKGKIADILDAYKTSQRDSDEAQYTQHVIRSSLDPLDFEHNAEIAGQYLEKHGHLLSEEERQKLKMLPKEALADEAVDLIAVHRANVRSYKSKAKQRYETTK